MDKSKKFILMFNAAKYSNFDDFTDFDITKDRQDQLQEMVEKFKRGKHIDLFWMMKALHDFQVIYTYGLGITSMEQLWLAFVMKENYSKQWLTDKEEWCKI